MGDKRGGKLPIMHCRTGQTDFHAECWEFESEYDWQNWLCGLHEPITTTPVRFFFFFTQLHSQYIQPTWKWAKLRL